MVTYKEKRTGPFSIENRNLFNPPKYKENHMNIPSDPPLTFRTERNEKTSLLFICLGNICRSVTAEEIFRVLARKAGRENQFEIDSAGIIDYHRGELADPRMREHAKRHGYILTHRSRPIVTADFLRFGLIVAMDAQNVRALKQAAPNAECCKKIVEMASFLTQHNAAFIPDPYYGEDDDFEEVVELLEDACQGLLQNI
jgi:protein-tyrosine phosphatase